MASSQSERPQTAGESKNGRSGPFPVVPGVARISLPPIITFLAFVAILYFGKSVLMPVAIALLLTFALAPIVSALRRAAMPKIVAVLTTVCIAFAAISLVGFIVATQVSQFAINIPQYQSNIVAKIQSLKEMGGGGMIDRLTGAVERIGRELEAGTSQVNTPTAEPTPNPVPVEIVARQSPVDLLKNIVVPLISPFATVGLIVVVVIFMLLEREGLRDRFIRLVGASDLHRTTEALHDAGRRVGQYLLMQLLVNVTYGIPIAIGLWFLGIPNAVLWGLLAMILRFVPYIGPVIAMVLPITVTFAVAPGWTPVLLTIGLFTAVELVSNNVVEPWLYGSKTGLSSLAIIVSAIFWAWIWGPVGLVISTPLTVCLVVLGKHVPHFEFLDVLFGNEPVLEPKVRVYQRLLAGDPDEAADFAEEILEEEYLIDFYDKIGVPALMLGEQDRKRGVMSNDTLDRFARSARAMVDDLSEIADEEVEELDEAEESGVEESGSANRRAMELPDGEGRKLVCIGGRTGIDDAAAGMLAQAMTAHGAEAQALSYDTLFIGRLRDAELGSAHAVVITYLQSATPAQMRHAVRRVKRQASGVRVGLYLPSESKDAEPFEASAANADFVAATIADAITKGFANEKPVPLRISVKRYSTRRKGKTDRKAAA